MRYIPEMERKQHLYMTRIVQSPVPTITKIGLMKTVLSRWRILT